MTTLTHSPAALWIEQRFDSMAIGLSGLCVVHCIASSVFIALASTAGGLLLNPLFHEIGLTIAIGFGILALGRGIFTHGYMMPAVVGSGRARDDGGGDLAAARRIGHGDGVDADRRRDPRARPRSQPTRR